MKIAKLTWLYNGNYGSILQAYALQKFLLDNGFDVEDVNYKASLKTKLKNWFVSHNSLSLFFIKYKESKGRKNKKYKKEFQLRKNKFDKFRNNYIKLTKMYTSPEELKNTTDNYDLFICGSDQIWSPYLFNPTFYFSFLPEGKKRIAYAPSFGVSTIAKCKEKKIADLLKKFNGISIRENKGKELINKLINKDVPVVVDPTMLLNNEKWTNVSGKSAICDIPYIFCYLLNENKIYIDEIKRFAKSKNMKVIIVPTEKGPFNTGFEEKINIGPDEWLNLIKNASFVFTDSFHGGIFSMIFHINFVLFQRFANNKKNSENSRIYSLAKMVNLEDRIIDEKNISNLNSLKTIDYKLIDKLIDENACFSKEWLINTINESE